MSSTLPRPDVSQVPDPEWQRSKLGRPWCKYLGHTICVFWRSNGYAWSLCSSKAEGVIFSHNTYKHEADAMDAVAGQVMRRVYDYDVAI